MAVAATITRGTATCRSAALITTAFSTINANNQLTATLFFITFTTSANIEICGLIAFSTNFEGKTSRIART
jgi:hypothetical protein